MINTSFEFRQRIADTADVRVRAQLVLADGRRMDLSGDDIAGNSLAFDQSVSSQGSFDVGGAIVGGLKLTLNNDGRRFDDIDFDGSRIIPSVGVDVGGEVEWLRKGTYWVEQPRSYSETIPLSCVDSMSKFDVPYSRVGTRYPATAQTVVRDVCQACGVPLLDAAFHGWQTVFKQRPDNDPTCRQVLSWAAQATGNWARVTADDRMELAWYDPSVWDEEDWLDGEEFDDASPYQSGSDADGGNFIDYSSGDSYDGGSFETGRIVHIHAYSDATLATDDVVVTGIRVTASDEVRPDGSKGAKGETVTVGSEGYVLEVSGNPLVSYGEARATASRIAARTVGLRFRPFDVSCIGDPRVEPGDPAIITDRHQNAHRGYLTRVAYKVGGFAAYSCSAKSPLRNAAAGGGAFTRAILGLAEDVRNEQTAREIALQRLNDDLAAAPGMYVTTKSEDGGTSWYLHDKRDLKDSKIVWKVNSAGFGMSIDGGKNYSYGLDKWGNAILNTVYAIGLNADYITAGSLSVRSGGKTIFCADVRSGQFWWDSTYSKLSNTGALTVTSGKIAGFTVSDNKLYTSRSSLKSIANGVYVGSDGISTGNGANWCAISSGAFFGGNGSSTEKGWLSLAYIFTSSKKQVSILAGQAGVCILGGLYVGNYVSRGSSPSVWKGTSPTLRCSRIKSGYTVKSVELTGKRTLQVALANDKGQVVGCDKITVFKDVTFTPGAITQESLTFKKGIVVSS